MSACVLLYDGSGAPLGRFRMCASRLCRLRGLMFRRRLPGDGLFFVFPSSRRAPWAVGIHMFFVFFPIAAIWLDEEGRIVHAVEARPFRIYAPPAPARYLVEGRPALLRRVRPGDRLTWEVREAPRRLLRELLEVLRRGPEGFVRPSPIAALLLEQGLRELEEALGRPPRARDVLRAGPLGLWDGFWREAVEVLREGVQALAALPADGALAAWMARRYPGERRWALRLAELLRDLPEDRGGAAVRALLQGQDPEEVVAAWRGLGLHAVDRDWRREPEFRLPCAGCGRRETRWWPALPRSLRAALAGHPGAWRLERPEAHVPLCQTCWRWRLRRDPGPVARRLWGRRFEALARWARAARAGTLPEWDRRAFPLWPPEWGGPTWEAGDPSFPWGTALRPPPFPELPQRGD